MFPTVVRIEDFALQLLVDLGICEHRELTHIAHVDVAVVIEAHREGHEGTDVGIGILLGIGNRLLEHVGLHIIAIGILALQRKSQLHFGEDADSLLLSMECAVLLDKLVVGSIELATQSDVGLAFAALTGHE